MIRLLPFFLFPCTVFYCIFALFEIRILAMKVICIYNGKAGGGSSIKSLENIKGLFLKYSIDAKIILTKSVKEIHQLLNEIDLSLFDGLISAGGDGSFFSVLNAYMKRKSEVDIPLGVLPVGTGNSLSKDLLKEDGESEIEDYIKLIKSNEIRGFDIVKVSSDKETFYYANMMGFGFITDVAQSASKMKFFGAFSYTLGILYNTIKLKPFELKIIIDGVERIMENVFIIISNSKYTGGDYLIAPKAKVNDGKFDLIILNKLSRVNLLKTFPKIFDGSHIDTPFVEYIQANKVKLESVSPKVLSPDGEIYGKFPVEVSCIPNKINVFSNI